MLAALRAFADPDATGFAYPRNADAARTKWGEAFFVYVKLFAPVTPPPGSPPPPMPPAPVTSGVAAAFHDALALSPSLLPMPSGTDLAAAWAAAMTSMVTLTAPVPPSWPDLSTRESTLRTTLDVLLAVPALAASERLGKIRDAFATATSAITSGPSGYAYG